MALFRHWAHTVLLLALLAGCSQSLFADGAGGGNGGPGPGAPDAMIGVMPGEPDGGLLPREDGGLLPLEDGGLPPLEDGGDGRGDAGDVRRPCPQPCAGDAFGDYRSEQGGANGRWRYVEVQPEQLDSPYVNMMNSALAGPVPGWRGTGDVEPTIALCATPQDEPPCLELSDQLALTSPGNAANAHHPGLMWTAPADGRYRLTGQWSVSSIAPAVPTTMKLTRNSHSEVLHEDSPTLTTAPYEFSVEIDAMQGDRIVLTATATTEQSVSVGVSFFVTGPI